MYPTEEDLSNIVRICLMVEGENFPIRVIFTENPEAYLKMYCFAWYNNIDIDLDAEEKDGYCDTIGTIKDIEIAFGGKYTLTSINITVELRDYK